MTRHPCIMRKHQLDLEGWARWWASAGRCHLCSEVLLLGSDTPMGMDVVSWMDGCLCSGDWYPSQHPRSHRSASVPCLGCPHHPTPTPPPPLAFVDFFGHQITQNLSTGNCIYQRSLILERSPSLYGSVELNPLQVPYTEEI